MILASAQNSKIKLVNRLRSKRGREQASRFLIDYERDLQRALSCGYQVDFILHCPEIGEIALPEDVDAYQVVPQLMTRISYRENPSGIIAVMHSQATKGFAEIGQAPVNRALVLVDLRVPGNVGALLRTADAAGIDAVLLVDSALDIYNPNIIRSSTGACFIGDIFQLSSAEAISYLRRNGFQIVCADVSGLTSIYEFEFRSKSAIVLGAEDSGLSQFWIDQADCLVHIPMAGRLSDSLNVSVSGAVFLYELYRQRHAS